MNMQIKQWLFNPFEYIAGSKSLLIGTFILVLISVLAYFGNMHFAGLFNVRTGTIAPLWFFLVKILVVWLLLSITMYFSGLIISRSKIRAIDVFGTQAMSRWPLLLPAMIAAVFPISVINERMSIYLLNTSLGQTVDVEITTLDIIIFTVMAILALGVIIWAIALSWNAYKVSCNVKGGKATIAFILALLTTEVLSYFVLSPLYNSIS